MPGIGIIDYGAGNLMSVSNALDFLGVKNEIISQPDMLDGADAIILPGVGAFSAAVECLRATGFVEALKEQTLKKPLLGICVGMQMLFEAGYEFKTSPGLCMIPGEVRKIDTKLKLPHIGWNSITIHQECSILQGIDNGVYVYFVHSFAGRVKDNRMLAASSDYGADIAAVVNSGNVFGTQFHPEKSGDAGLQILKNFCDLAF